MSKYLKAIVSFAVAVVAGGVAQGLINGAAAAWATIVIGALATAGVYVAKNAELYPDRWIIPPPHDPPTVAFVEENAPVTPAKKKAAAKKVAAVKKAAKKR